MQGSLFNYILRSKNMLMDESKFKKRKGVIPIRVTSNLYICKIKELVDS